MEGPRLLALFLLVLVVLAGASTAVAGPERVAVAQRLAEDKFGKVCGGEPVTITRGKVPGLAQASYSYSLAQPDNAELYRNCIVTLRGGRIPWDEFCHAIRHEWAHLDGWRAPPGQAYVDSRGRVDRFHSRRRTSLMYPRIERIHPLCRGARPPRIAPPPPPPASGLPLFLLPPRTDPYESPPPLVGRAPGG